MENKAGEEEQAFCCTKKQEHKLYWALNQFKRISIKQIQSMYTVLSANIGVLSLDVRWYIANDGLWTLVYRVNIVLIQFQRLHL